TLTGGSGSVSIFASTLQSDLQTALKKHELKLYYQPQFDSMNNCIGAEALLRWKHPVCGNIYPPLVCQLAMEGDFLELMERYIFEIAFNDVQALIGKLPENFRISVNVTGKTIQNEEFQDFLTDLMNRWRLPEKLLCIEITEQASLCVSDKFISKISELKKCGYTFAIDDFSMGHTSIAYLKTNLFDEVKLDGSLVKDMMSNERCKDIINSIAMLSQTLDFHVLAEYVETKEQREALMQLGCNQYQGYLYSPAISLEALAKVIQGK
nr:EAL domain-containing protein [Treponemataceae bacterium]